MRSRIRHRRSARPAARAFESFLSSRSTSPDFSPNTEDRAAVAGTYGAASMTASDENGAHDRLTLAFLDAGLEDRYQRAAGAESLNGFRAIALASGVLWTLAAFV